MAESHGTTIVGSSPPRGDGPDKVRGIARYVDDLLVPDLWHGATVRSPHARARVRHIDLSAARAQGAVCLSAADVPAPGRIKLIADDWPVLVREVAEHFAEPVVLVAAPTREAAHRAALAVRIDWEPLPAILDLDAALAGDPRAPLAGPLVLAKCAMERGDAVGALQRADHVVEGTYSTGLQEHVYIEPQGMIAAWRQGGTVLDIVGSMQCPYYVHKALSALFALKEERVRVRQSVTGGGFGGKEEYPDLIAAHAALLARAAGRPVKIVYDRREDIRATPKRHPARIHHRAGFAADGTLVALDIEILLDGGAYTTLSPVVLSRAVLHAGGPYRCANVRVRGRALATNAVPNGAFRGFGAPQAQFAMERQMDAAARALDLDPLTIRERNAYRLGDRTPTGQVLDESVSALECLARAEALTSFRARWRAAEDARARAPLGGQPRRGIGLALAWHGAGFTGNGEREMRSPVELELLPGGRVRVLVAASDFGQGTERVLPQIVAEALGVGLEQVEYAQPDTARVPDSGPTVASRTVMIVGGLLARAAQRMAAVLEEHRRSKALADFASAADDYLAVHGTLRVRERFVGDDSEFDEATYTGTAYAAYGWACNVVEAEVDEDTLAIQPTRVTTVTDVGRAIHPLMCSGQIEGGTLQALAWGYLEDVRLTAGRPLQDSMQTCLIPTALDAPEMETVLLENPSKAGPFGAKGVGELPMDAGAPALVGAIENALGISPTAIPVTPERLFEMLERSAGAGEDGTP